MPRKRALSTRKLSSSGDRVRAEDDVEWQVFPWLSSVVAVLFTARFFLPAESAAQGETLWIALLWLACGVLWLIDAYRLGEPLRRFDWLDAGLLLLVSGHVVSALAVLMTAGDKRSALNMLWEWIGMGAAGLLIREVMRERASRERMLSCLLASGVVLSGLGLWQHYVWYPRISAQFGELERLEQASATGTSALSSVEQKQVNGLRQELGFSANGDVASQRAMRDRIQASTEPIGRFALANTFAGLLIVAVLLSLGMLQSSLFPHVTPVRAVAGVLLVGVLSYCLLLTKSRTAMVGLTCGLLIGLCLMGRTLLMSRWGRWSALGAGVGVGVMILAAVLSGSLDRQVISETPKSLRYRLEYWTATGDVIREHPILGVGPGNFRQHYLKHKLPESSEEILDPHNFVLDVWANGGLIALAGLACLLGVIARRCLLVVNRAVDVVTSDDNGSVFNEIVLRGAIGSLAIVLAALVELFQGTDIRSDWLWLAGGWWGTVTLLTLTTRELAQGRLVVMAMVGLLLHLSGAGGIAMPAILQVALVLIFVIDALKQESASGSGREIVIEPTRRRSLLLLTSICVGLAAVVTCATTAALPVTKAKMAMLEGHAAVVVARKPHVAERAFLLATQIDRLSPEPWMELARVRFGQWMQKPTESEFASAVEALEQAITRDPASFGRWKSLGDIWWERFDRLGEEGDADQALSAYRQAAERYPHLADVQADVAKAAKAVGEVDLARESAQRALNQDALNREFGHADKILTPDLMAKLRKIVDEAKSPDPE